MNILRQIQQAMRLATIAIIVLTIMVVVVWGRGLMERENGTAVSDGAATDKVYVQTKVANSPNDSFQGVDTLDWLDSSSGFQNPNYHPYHFDPNHSSPQDLFHTLFGNSFGGNMGGEEDSFLFSLIDDAGIRFDLYEDRGTFSLVLEGNPFFQSPSIEALLTELTNLLTNPSSLPPTTTDFVVGERFDLKWNDPPTNSFASNYNPFQSVRYGGTGGSNSFGAGGFGGNMLNSSGGSGGGSNGRNGNGGNNGNNGNGGGTNPPGTNGGTNPPDGGGTNPPDTDPPVVVLPEPGTLGIWLGGTLVGFLISRRRRPTLVA